MNRRQFITLCGTGALVAASEGVWAQHTTSAVLNVGLLDEGIGIAPAFLGFSYESSLLSDPAYFSVDNKSLIALIRRLGPNGVLRIGGNTSDHTFWRPNGGPGPKTTDHTVTPADLTRLAAFVDVLGWRVIYGLNFASGTPEMAADEAAAVAAALGYSLLAFQIGNEPNLYHDVYTGPGAGHEAEYVAGWQKFAAAIQSRVPLAPLAGPDTAPGPEWTQQFVDALSSRILFLSDHFYSDGPASSPKVTIDRMLRSAGHYQGLMHKLQSECRETGLQFRMTETNSVYNGGKYGVSDTFASALWGLNMMFQTAAAGGIGVNFHGGPRGAYTPIAQSADGTFAPRPLYLAMLLFSLTGYGELLPSTLTGAEEGVSAYAIRHDKERRSVLVINASSVKPQTVQINPNNPVIEADIIRFTAPSLDATSGITLGGTVIGADGSWAAPDAPDSVPNVNGRFAVTVPAASAAWVRFTSNGEPVPVRAVKTPAP